MEKPVKAIIIDDEELARSLIRMYLQDFDSVEIICECENGFEGLKAVNELNPDLIFLDIQMPKLTGFEMLEIMEKRPEIIFITAHNEFAIRAFELNALDYLLKPYSKERLLSAISKALDRLKNDQNNDEKVKHLLEQPVTNMLERVVVKSGSKIKVIPVDKIEYLEAEDDYVMIFHAEGKSLKQATMKYFENHLESDKFIRVHRSFIVRIDQVVQLEPYSKDNYIIKLRSGATVKVSKSGLKNLKEKLKF